MKKKKCRVCKAWFPPFSSLHVVCSPDCLFEYAKQQEQKKFDKRTRELKKKAKTKFDYTKEAQAEFNKYIRLRDKDLPCISCNRHHDGQYHAGHYLSVGAHPELRFEEDNCHKQCSPCNNHLSGNIVRYRQQLILKIGLDRVEWLEGKHKAKHYIFDDLIEIKRKYVSKIKELK